VSQQGHKDADKGGAHRRARGAHHYAGERCGSCRFLKKSAGVAHYGDTGRCHTVPPCVVVRCCQVDEDCNLNGLCTTDGCSCLPGWRGPACGELNLVPATVGAGLHAAPTSNLSSWGGWVGWDARTRRWQMMANEMVHGCGINSWEANSRVVRASTADLNQPFQVEAEVKQPFGSEPTLARLSSGAWLMFSIGNR
jgi:hypothetical protein